MRGEHRFEIYRDVDRKGLQANFEGVSMMYAFSVSTVTLGASTICDF